jgi:phage/plasmid-like protein (TIGR03299 family)
MAHELVIEGGRAAMFYVDEVPWHGLGTRLSTPPTSKEAIRAARLDWMVVKAPLYVAGGARLHELPDRFALLRADKLGQDDCHVFGLAGRDYVALQNVEAFDFFDPLVREGHAAYETAGALGHGERIWILARLASDLDVVDGDVIQRFLLLSNSHDGSSSVQVKLTPVRVVCQNTLSLALREGSTIRVRHDRDVKLQLEASRAFLGIVRGEYERLGQLFRQLATTRITADRARSYFEHVFPDGRTDEATRLAIERRRWAHHFFRNGRGQDRPAVRDTLWAAYNGVTELVDHVRPRNAGDFTSRRLRAIWFGSGAAAKERALKVAADWTATTFQPR